VWDVDFEILRDYIQRFNNGTWPSPSTAAGTPTSSPEERTICP